MDINAIYVLSVMIIFLISSAYFFGIITNHILNKKRSLTRIFKTGLLYNLIFCSIAAFYVMFILALVKLVNHFIAHNLLI
jgi:hypothetical protein